MKLKSEKALSYFRAWQRMYHCIISIFLSHSRIWYVIYCTLLKDNVTEMFNIKVPFWINCASKKSPWSITQIANTFRFIKHPICCRKPTQVQKLTLQICCMINLLQIVKGTTSTFVWNHFDSYCKETVQHNRSLYDK